MSYDNYLRLCETIRHIEKNGAITEDWMEEEKSQIELYSDVFPTLSKVNEDIEDGEFRTRAREGEAMLVYLLDEIRRTRTFNVEVYIMFCKHLKRMTEITYEEDELMGSISSMSIANVANRV
jgi:hypothetical protein